ncbi:hypothetical protein BS17DRAFT_766831 [Gyrodon lividus]|nr:hypothetical protein BS17DRAFT_766831 [Gyrodon lividus]
MWFVALLSAVFLATSASGSFSIPLTKLGRSGPYPDADHATRVGIGSHATYYKPLLGTVSYTFCGTGTKYVCISTSTRTGDTANETYGLNYFPMVVYPDQVTLAPNLVITDQFNGEVSGNRGHRPRSDSFPMHALDATLFVHSLLEITLNVVSKVKPVKTFLSVTMMCTLVRGRPRVDPRCAMSYTGTPRPPSISAPTLTPSQHNIGDLNQSHNSGSTSWRSSFTHLTYTLKGIRALCYAAPRYGQKTMASIPDYFMDEMRQGGDGVQDFQGGRYAVCTSYWCYDGYAGLGHAWRWT